MLVDESLPKRIRREMPGFTVWTVAQRDWSRTKNGALLRLAEGAEFDGFLTADQSLRYQQNLAGSKLRIIVLEGAVQSHGAHRAATVGGDACAARDDARRTEDHP